MKIPLRGIIITTLGTLAVVAAWANPFGPPNGYTSAPADRPTTVYGVPHRNSFVRGGGSVRVAFPNGLTYTPGQPQTLLITVADAAAFTSFKIPEKRESKAAVWGLLWLLFHNGAHRFVSLGPSGKVARLTDA